ncbi:MAG: putative ATP-dependent helicase lhr [Labilithrix sp.]|nr:putative ATP-dependent helicase lhr [Labilithrix sp.]
MRKPPRRTTFNATHVAARKTKTTAAPQAAGAALDAFHPATAAWFRAALGAPTLAQELAWPRIAAGETTLLLAPTGSGKTLAAFLSAIDRLAQEKRDPDEKNKLRVLYVSPLKALAVDVERNLRAPLAGVAEAASRLGTPLRKLEVAVRTGDTLPSERARILRSPPDLLITTPESLSLLLTSSQREMLTSVDAVIIDEIHQMAASKRGAHLFVSLERLQALRPERPLQRIGLSATQRPLEEIARLLGGFAETTSGKKKTLTARPVAIVDASAKKALSITVEVPPPLPDGLEQPIDDPSEGENARSIWPQLHVRLVERIRAARSTMVFVNSRRLAERLATALNETAEEEIALAHHGSVAKDSRRAIEERLKAGELPCIVATSSLELGIDMGAVDQVIQVEAPPSVASGIQRIGRASHHVGGVPSGVLVPKHKHDLLACAAAAAGIESGDVEETYYARNPLDVLAQQIVAITSVGIPRAAPLRRGERKAKKPKDDGERDVETEVEAIWDLVRRAAPFAELPRASFDGVLDMLAGRYPSDEFSDLRARITWDRTRGVVTPRAGSKRLAIQNAGTIPDRGLYGVFLQDGSDQGDREGGRADEKAPRKDKGSRRVGELDEEMVFELREGEVFLLGASSWRAEQITRDRVLVTPAAGIPGKMPFWHGDRAGRTVAFGERIGKLTREIASRDPASATRLLREEHHLDERSAADLLAYVKEEAAASGAVPSDKTIVVQRVPDELGDLRICVLTPYGSRVHAPWAMATLRALREARAGDIEAVSTDDGMVFRVPGGEEPLPVELLFPSPDEIEDVVTRELGGSSMFAARFREAAARALLLPRNHVGKRTPLWAQRKRSADLLAVAQQYPSFPIVLETYRECLRDAFDLPGLVELLRAVASRKIRVTTVDLTTPSPMAASLLFSFVGNFIYDQDAPAAERRAQALTIDHAQLRELLGETELRKLLDADVVLEHGRQLQRLDRPLRHADAVHDLLLWVGDLGADEIRRRADPALVTDGKPAPAPAQVTGWIDQLVLDRRVVRVRIAGEERFVAVEDVARYRDALGVVLERGLPAAFLEPTKDALTSLVARYARTHGPFLANEIAARWGIGEASVEAALGALVGAGKVVTGTFLASPSAQRARSGGPVEYCDAEVLKSLKRKTLARLRKSIEPVAPEDFARFLTDWQGIIGPDDARAARLAASPVETLLRAIGQLEGCPVPASVLETEVLPARVPGYRSFMLDQLLASGEVVWAGIEPIGSHDGRVALYLADREPLLARSPGPADATPSGALHAKLRELFERRGALFFGEITRTLAVYPQDVLTALWDLVWAGEVTNDTLEPLRSSLAAGRTEKRGRPAPRPARLGPRGSEGRWSLRRSRWERTPSSTERATAIARAMLERYGIVLREAPHAEGLPGGFANVYDVYRALEDQGRVRRGYFVAERGATQFALPGAEERLRTKRPDDEEPRLLVLAATDPANPYGSLLPWPAGSDLRGTAAAPAAVADDDEEPAKKAVSQGRAQRSPGARVILHDGHLLGWVSRGGQNLVTFLPRDEPRQGNGAAALGRALVDMAKRRGRSAMLVTIDGEPALESPLAKLLAPHGFVGRRGVLVYIPPAPKAMPRGVTRGGADLARTIASPGVVSFDRNDAALLAAPGALAAAKALAPSLDEDLSYDDDPELDGELMEDELAADLAEIGADGADFDLPPDAHA